jgi:hypothetical protein
MRESKRQKPVLGAGFAPTGAGRRLPPSPTETAGMGFETGPPRPENSKQMQRRVVGQFAVAAPCERRNSLRIQDRRSETAATNYSKKILNRGNEPKDLLKTHDLSFFGAKNEPKTNPILSAKRGNKSEKAGPVENRISKIEIRNSKPGVRATRQDDLDPRKAISNGNWQM